MRRGDFPGRMPGPLNPAGEPGRERVIVFTRFPVAGATKTRLIPVLGPQGSADLSRQMTEHTLARVGRCCSHADVSLEVRYEGGDYRSMRHWLGRRFRFRRQGKGDLGMRMSGAVRDAFLAGAQRVVLVGTDCPKLQEAHIRDAFHALRKKPLVLGPARDGGYYLIALRRNSPELFEDIEWGTHRVLDQTLARARMLGLEPELLEVLDDIDRPEDLPIWEQERGVC